ncbi:Panacea domain-containing protein [Thermodesulfobacteriota bacterium]
MKLLYFLDFIHFKHTGKSVTGLDYYAWQMGPVPRDLYEEISGGNKKAPVKEAHSFRQSFLPVNRF